MFVVVPLPAAALFFAADAAEVLVALVAAALVVESFLAVVDFLAAVEVAFLAAALVADPVDALLAAVGFFLVVFLAEVFSPEAFLAADFLLVVALAALLVLSAPALAPTLVLRGFLLAAPAAVVFAEAFVVAFVVALAAVDFFLPTDVNGVASVTSALLDPLLAFTAFAVRRPERPLFDVVGVAVDVDSERDTAAATATDALSLPRSHLLLRRTETIVEVAGGAAR